MKKLLPLALIIVATIALFFLPSVESIGGGEKGERAIGEVIAVDDSGVEKHGLIEYGAQRLRVKLADGSEREATNTLRA